VKIRKGVILAAGFGTRFLPQTKAVPKEMLPIVDRPVIQYVVEEALAAGLEQIFIVTNLQKRDIEQHFDHDFELESSLEAKGKSELLHEVARLAEMDITFVRQKERLGNGHAVLTVRNLIGDEPFALFFADDVIVHRVPAIGQLIDAYKKYDATIVAVQQVPREQVVHYGVIEPEDVEPRVYRIKSIIEKPKVDEAPSDLTTVGRFVLTPEIFDTLDETPVGRAGEVWLMDALDRLSKAQPVYAYQYEGERFDTGQPVGLLKASISLGLRNEDMGQELREFIRSLPLD
jgi:UTP--glucose-1-phosphate uridylyltransferase